MDAPVTPLNDKVLVKRLQPREESQGGILIPTDAREKPLYGVVRAVGIKVEEPALKTNVMILFGKYTGIEVKVGTEDLLLLREEEILGIVVDPELINEYMSVGV